MSGQPRTPPPPSDQGSPSAVSRRRFLLELGAGLGGAAITGGLAGAAKWLGLLAPLDMTPGGTTPGVVDYDKVPTTFDNGTTLHVAQWYQYWPPSFLDAFVRHIMDTYGKSITVVQEIYDSNEQLFNWITQTGKKFDVMFPTDYMIQAMDRAGLLVNLNPNWLPNFSNLFPAFRDVATNAYEYRSQGNALRAVPYQWGMTGIGFRTDKGWTRADVEADGWDVFWKSTYMGQNLTGKTMMLDDMRQTFGATFKRTGWDEQRRSGITPTNLTDNPAPPYNGQYQWSLNEQDDAKLNGARDSLLGIKPSLYDFNTANQGPYLVQDIVWMDTAWSGDIMYAIRPNTASPQPVDFALPVQGFPKWTDAAVAHKESHNLFLAHELIDFFLDPQQGATITDWNLYATPNQSSFDLLKSYPSLGWDPRQDVRIYGDTAVGYTGPSIFGRSETLKDVGADWTARYANAWNIVKFG